MRCWWHAKSRKAGELRAACGAWSGRSTCGDESLSCSQNMVYIRVHVFTSTDGDSLQIGLHPTETMGLLVSGVNTQGQRQQQQLLLYLLLYTTQICTTISTLTSTSTQPRRQDFQSARGTLKARHKKKNFYYIYYCKYYYICTTYILYTHKNNLNNIHQPQLITNINKNGN